jgi:cholesterol oxidase
MSLTRRELLQLTAVAGAGAVGACTGDNAPNDSATDAMDAAMDAAGDTPMVDAGPGDGGVTMARVVIIGSGFGGAVAALRLAEAGIDSIVLERGKRWPIRPGSWNTFAQLLLPDRRSTWLSETTVLPFGPIFTIQRYIGVLERVVGNGINLYHGAGVGGGSLVYGGMLVTPREEAFTHVFPSTIPYAEMSSTYYPRARATLRATPCPDDIIQYDEYTSERVFRDQATRAGVNYQQVDVGVDWDVIRAEHAGTVPRSALNGEVIYGNNNGCKISLDMTYLKDAEASGHCQVLPQHRVRDITRADSGKYVVMVDEIDDRGETVSLKTFVCDYLFVSAGCNGTNNLFVKAKAKGLLPMLDDHVGQNFGNNGNAMFMRWDLGVSTGARGQGSFAGQAIADFDNPISAALVEHAQFPSGQDCNCLLQLGMCLDTGAGNFTYDATTDRAVVNWPDGAANTPMTAMQNLADRLNTANGGTLNGSALNGQLVINGILTGFTYHPIGGMTIGTATDLYGRVNNYPKLYVLDGSLLPRSAGGVNPALTITALAERCIEKIIMEDFA